MENKNRVAVVVVTYNRKKLLNRCLESLVAQTVPLSTIIVVDNASSDGTDELVTSYVDMYGDKIVYIRHDKNTGGAGGFCTGFKHAMKSEVWDWLMVMDDDAAPEPEYTEKLLKFAEKNPEVKAYIGTEYVGDTDRIAYGGRRIIDKAGTVRTCIVPEDFYKKACFNVDTAVFVGLMMHRTVVSKAGYPDKDFFIYYDDTDYCLKLRKYTEILHVTDARIIHRENYEKDVLAEGQQLWRFFYLYRNELVIKKRYIKNPIIRYGWIVKNYFRKIIEIIRNNDRKCKRISLVTRATFDVLTNRLGKVKYFDGK